MVGAAGFGVDCRVGLSLEGGVNYYWVLMQAKTTLDSGKNQVLSVNNARLLSYEPL